MQRIAPNLQDEHKLMLLRPTPGFADPPLCTILELRESYTLDDLMDFHEVLDLRDALRAKVEAAKARNTR